MQRTSKTGSRRLVQLYHHNTIVDTMYLRILSSINGDSPCEIDSSELSICPPNIDTDNTIPDGNDSLSQLSCHGRIM
jgi:hypothetical protein